MCSSVIQADGSTASWESLVIVGPQNNYFPLLENSLMRISVYNYSNYLLPASGNCTINFFNETGHYIDGGMFVYEGMTWYYTINKSLASNVRTLSYNLLCNDTISDKYGYLAGTIDINTNGPVNNNPDTLPIVIAIGMTSFLFLFMMSVLDPEHWLLKLMCAFVFIFLMIQLPSALITGQTGIQDNLLKTSIFFARFFVGYIIVYFVYTVWLKRKLFELGILKEPKQEI